MELTISLEAVCRIVLRAREFDAQVPEDDPEDGSDPVDDEGVEVLEDEENNAVEEELRTMIDDLNEDEQNELVALAWVGRGTYDASEWNEALEVAADEVSDPAEYLLELPILGSYLEAGLAAFDLSCDDVGQVS
jgi:hypothetical protein